MGTVKNIEVKKQVNNSTSSPVSKPKAEASKEDIKVFGSLSTSTKNTSSSSDKLSERLQEAQGKKVKRDDAQVSAPIFGSLTGVQSTPEKATRASIFSSTGSQASQQEDLNEVKASDVAVTKEAIEKENAQTGKRFDSNNFASADTPIKESKGRGSQKGGQRGGNPNTISVTRPNTRSNNVIDTYTRYSTGNSRSAFLNQRQRDFDEVMSLELNTSGSSAGSKSSNLSSGVSSGGSGGGCSGGGGGGSYDCGSGHHKSGVNWGKVLAWGAGGLALGALGAYGISALISSAAKKSANPGAEITAQNGSNVNTGSQVNVVNNNAGTAAESIATPAASAAVAAAGNAAQTNGAPSGIDSTCKENANVISELQKATPETAPQALAKADTQYGNMSGAIKTKEGELSTTNSNLGKTQGELSTIEGQSKECETNIKSAEGVITDTDNQITKQDEFIQSLTKQKDGYTQKANDLGTKITEKETAIGECDAAITQLESDLSTITDPGRRSSITAQLEQKRAEKQQLETEKGKLEGEKQSYEEKATQLEQKDIPQAEQVKSTLESDKATAEEKKKALEQQLTQYKQQQDGLEMQAGTLEGQAKTIEGQQKTLNQDMNKLNSEREKLARQMNTTFQSECRDRGYVSRLFNRSAGNDYTIGAATNEISPVATAAAQNTASPAVTTSPTATPNATAAPADASAQAPAAASGAKTSGNPATAHLAQAAPAFAQTAAQAAGGAEQNGSTPTAQTGSTATTETKSNNDAQLGEQIRKADGKNAEEKVKNSGIKVSEEWVQKHKAEIEAE